ncbi:MAG: hypothetical protein AAF517_20025 [Planctomycetota bacterium]
MRNSNRRRIGICGLLCTLAFAAGVSRVSAVPFDPQKHFPEDALVYAEIDCGEMRTQIVKTPLGVIVNHQGFRRALGKLPDAALKFFEEVTEDFQRETGVTIVEFFDHFKGRAAVTVPSVDLRLGPHLLFAAEIGPDDKKAVQVAETIVRATLGSNGFDQGTEENIRGFTVRQFPSRWSPPVEFAVVDEILVFSVGAFVSDFIDRYRGRETEDVLRRHRALRKLRAGRSRTEKIIGRALIDSAKCQETAFEVMQHVGEPANQVKGVLSLLGLDTTDWLGYEFGFRDGDWEGRLRLQSTGKLTGLVKELAEVLSAPSDLEGLSLIPSNAAAFSGSSIHLGRLSRSVVSFFSKFEEVIPEASGVSTEIVSTVESVTGLSVRQDLYTLPRLDLFSFVVHPDPASLIPDVYLVSPLSQVAPYLEVLDKVASHWGGQTSAEEVQGQTVAKVGLTGFLKRLGLEAELGPSLANDLGFSVIFAPMESGWVLMSPTLRGAGRPRLQVVDLPPRMNISSNSFFFTLAPCMKASPCCVTIPLMTALRVMKL